MAGFFDNLFKRLKRIFGGKNEDEQVKLDNPLEDRKNWGFSKKSNRKQSITHTEVGGLSKEDVAAILAPEAKGKSKVSRGLSGIFRKGAAAKNLSPKNRKDNNRGNRMEF
jgi:hypothetical protein